ncbi:hypothetical protein BH09CHL1_BH09CHL1_18790 [soil metagenome]
MSLSRSSLTRRTLIAGSLSLALAPKITRAEPAAVVENQPAPLRDPSTYMAYIPTASKTGQYAHYTCEFDAAWAIMKTYGVESTLERQLEVIGVDRDPEPYYTEDASGIYVYGGDLEKNYCGDWESNFLARSRGKAMRKVFESYGLSVRGVHDRKGIEDCLKKNRLIFIKTTVDFKPWVPATWITPDNKQYPVVLGNDHAVVVMGYDEHVVVIRDVLGPTSTNWERPYEYEVYWNQFLSCWGAQGSDGLAVWVPEPDEAATPAG